VDQRALGELAERAAELAAQGGPAAAGELTRLVDRAAQRYHLAPWTVTSMIAGEWDRLGIKRTPKGVNLNA
jgi:hypothetical protein